MSFACLHAETSSCLFCPAINQIYYYLINGYKDLFLDRTQKTESYINNTRIEELYALYKFDKNLKINFLKYYVAN